MSSSVSSLPSASTAGYFHPSSRNLSDCHFSQDEIRSLKQNGFLNLRIAVNGHGVIEDAHHAHLRHDVLRHQTFRFRTQVSHIVVMS
jgi:hypothetical protein